MTSPEARATRPARTDPVADHPRVCHLGRTVAEQERVDAFAREVAAWLVGDEPELGALASVVTRVARRELQSPRRLCADRPVLAIEATARAVESLWPWLRDALEEPEPPQEGAGASQAPMEGDSDEPQAGGDQGEDDEGDDDGETLAAAGPGEGEQEHDAASPIERGHGAEPGHADRLESMAGELADAATDGAMDAAKGLQALDAVLPGLGWSTSPGHLRRALVDQVKRLSALLDRLPALRQLADALGRVEDASRRQGAEQGGSEEVTGVRVGGDFANAVPSELGLLGDPETEDLFYQRWLDRQLITLELTGAGIGGVANPERRGPVIACIDTSGSMRGAPEVAAKALVLAIARRVVPQGRVVHLVLFSGPGDLVELRIRRGMGGLDDLLDFLALGFSGGTDFDAPLLRALDLLEERPLRQADVLVVTDGRGEAATWTTHRVQEARDRGVKVWSIVLGVAMSRGVKAFSDEVWFLDPRHAAEAVGLVRRFERR